MKIYKIASPLKRPLDSNVLIVVLFSGIAAFLRFYRLGFQSLGLDELASLDQVTGGLTKIIQSCKTYDINPPLYQIFLWLWTKLFGVNDSSARSLSALFGVLGVIAIYFLAKKLFSKVTETYAVLILSVNFFHIYYAQVARNYALAFLLTAISYLFFIRLCQRRDFRSYLLYTFFTALLIYTHYFGLLIVLSQAAFILFTLPGDKKKLSLIKYFSLSLFSLFILYVPWIPTVLQAGKLQAFWTPKPKPDFFIQYFSSYFGGEPFLIVLFSALLIIYLISDSSENPFTHDKVLLLSWVFITLLIPYIRSFGHPAPLNPRYTIVILPAIILMASRAIAFIKEPQSRAFLVAAIVVMSLVNLFFTQGNYYKMVKKAQWREAAQFVIIRDPKKLYPVYAHRFFDYYFNKVLSQGRDLHDLPRNRQQADQMYQSIKNGKILGLWILDAGSAFSDIRLDKKFRAFFEERLIKKYSINFAHTRATLYVSPWGFSVTDGETPIPLSSLAAEGQIGQRNTGPIRILGRARLITPELIFQRGRYRLVIKGKCLGGSDGKVRARIYADGYSKKEDVLFDQVDKDHELILEFPEEAKCNIYVDFDDVISEKKGPSPRIEIDALKIQRRESLDEFLLSRRNALQNSTMIISVRDTAQKSLSEASLGALKELGLLKIKDIKPENSYIAFIKNGVLIHEVAGSRKLQFREGHIDVVSAGKASGNVSSIVVDGIDYSKNEPGINIVIMDKNGLESYYVDTRKDAANWVKQ
jgi:hypothetical protein